MSAEDPAQPLSEESADNDAVAGPLQFVCPRCGQAVEAVPDAVARSLACPSCSEILLIPAIDGSTEVADEVEQVRAEIAQTKQSELDGLRMRNVIALRRTAMRSRSYAIVGGCACVVAAVKLVQLTVTDVRAAGWGLTPLLLIGVTILAVWAARQCFRRAAYWGRETNAIVLPDPDAPPDFSTLSDGTQHAKNLEQIK